MFTSRGWAQPAFASVGGGSPSWPLAGRWADSWATARRLAAALAVVLTLGALTTAVRPLVAHQGTAAGTGAPRAAVWPEGLRQAAEEAMAIEAYRAVPSGDGWTATNRAHGVEARFSAAGVSLHPTRGEAVWTWSLALSGVGRAGAVGPVAASTPIAANDRVEYRRGPVTEWYVNREGGIEQGFTVADAPAGTNGPVVVEMAGAGELVPRLADAGRAVTLADAGGGTVLRYDALHVFDAAGRELPAGLDVEGTRLRIVVDDTAAAYPLTIDPVISAEQKHLFATTDTTNDHVGWSVAVDGETAVVGAPLDETGVQTDAGAAFVFARNGTSWAQQKRLVASDYAGGDQFGFSVAISGDTAVVGAPFADGATPDRGTAYVFQRSGTAWSQSAALDGDLGGDQFGYSVAVSGDRALVGAPFDDGLQADEGSAQVLDRSGATWTKGQHLSVAGAFNDQYGFSVALDADTAVVGVPFDDVSGVVDRGSAYLYQRNAGGTFASQGQVSPGSGTGFGRSVAVSGNTAVIGHPSGLGSARVYVRSGTTWSSQGVLAASDGKVDDALGWSVAVWGDTAVVGAPFDDTAAGNNAGSAYVFARSGTSWSEVNHLFASDATGGAFVFPGDQFGWSVALSEETAVVGAPLDDTEGGTDAGSAYVYVPDAFSVNDVTVTEGNTGTKSITFKVTRTGTLESSASVYVHTVNGTATAPGDYMPVAKTVTFAPDQATKTVSVTIITDTAVEPNETFFLLLSGASGAEIADGSGRATITNDDTAAATLSIGNRTVTEGDVGTTPANFTVTRSGDTAGSATVEVHTQDGSATKADNDYGVVATTVTFAPGETTKTVTVSVIRDTVDEPNETFFVTLSAPSGATIADGFGQGTITDDD